MNKKFIFCLLLSTLVVSNLISHNNTFIPEISRETVGNEVFLQGNFMEVGIHNSGSYGASNQPPAGYHPMDVTGRLGFVADYQRDGWTVGNPPMTGDFFVPGTPEEGWTIQWNIGSLENTFHNYGLMNLHNIQTTELVETSQGDTQSASWKGHINTLTNGKLDISKQISFGVDDLYFTTDVTLTNTGNVTLESLEYMRNIDPDNEINITNNYWTYNWIDSQGSADNPRALVLAEGAMYGITLGLGAINQNARVSAEGFSNRFPDNIYDTPTAYDSLNKHYADEAIAIVFRFDELAPGESVNFKFVYILDRSALDEAMNSLEIENEDQTQVIPDSLFIDLFAGVTDSVLTSIDFSILPEHGDLFNGEELIALNENIQMTEFDSLGYIPTNNYFGLDSLVWNGYSNGELLMTSTIYIDVLPENDPPVNTEPPTIEGNFNLNGNLVCYPGDWNDDLDTQWADPSFVSVIRYEYLWQILVNDTWYNLTDSTDTDSLYTVTADDLQKYIRCQVTAFDNGIPGSAFAVAYSDSFFVGIPAEQPYEIFIQGGILQQTPEDTFIDIDAVAIDQDGRTFYWMLSNPIFGTAEFLPDSIRISTETKTIRYTPNPNYNGYDTFVLSVVNNVGANVYKTISVLSVHQNDPPVNTLLPEITGDFETGQIITCNTGEWNDDADNQYVQPGLESEIVYEYRWQKSDNDSTGFRDIQGFNESTYQITPDDESFYIRCMVIARDNGTGLGPNTTSFEFSNAEFCNALGTSPDAPVYKTEIIGVYPNPFNLDNNSRSASTIKFSLANDSNVDLKVFNLKGQLVKNLVNSNYKKGTYELSWNGSDENNKLLGSGLYFYKLKADNKEMIRKMILIK